MCLTSKLNAIDAKKWKYYADFLCKDYSQAIEKPIEFVRDYFIRGGKADFLLNSIFDEKDEVRARHVVNTYFLGIYLYENISRFQFNPQSFLSKDKNFLWAWFICALYHDACYNMESPETNGSPQNLNYSYCDFSRNLLYSKDTIEKYYFKETNPTTRHNPEKAHYDHGILAATKLYENYTTKTLDLISHDDKRFLDFINGNNIFDFCPDLVINLDTYKAICKIAKIIACHNIYICSNEEEKEKYKNAQLDELICSNRRFRFQPTTKERYLGTYEKLYFLLALVDTLEPTKREIAMENIDITAQYGDSKTILKISVSDKVSSDEENRYFNGIKQLNSWLNFVKVNEQGDIITIDFTYDKNKNA